MIERFYLRGYLSFEEVALELDRNLIVFTGPSGAGKSILMEALLTLFGMKECSAKVIEATITHPLDLRSVGIEEDEPNIFRFTREKAARYFINNQQISRKNMRKVSTGFISYLTLREFREFENDRLLHLLDRIAAERHPDHTDTLARFHAHYEELRSAREALETIEQEERKITELKEFAQYEIAKIESVSPSVDEYEQLMERKKALSKKEKIEEAISEASMIFEYEHRVYDALSLLEQESTFFDEAMNELRVIFEKAHEEMEALEGVDIEQLLDRIEQLSALKNRYGSIEAALEELARKKEELLHYENIAFEKSELEKQIALAQERLRELGAQMSRRREEALKLLNERVEHYLNLLYLERISFAREEAPLHPLGYDEISIRLGRTDLRKISAGELNRLRLAFLAAASEFVQSEGGVLILDEIDANVSGKESESVAKVLKQLSRSYQIFAISHQPQLSSQADMHFLVSKEGGVSRVQLLEGEERVHELSRMISGEQITEEAVRFARSLLS